MVRETNNVCFGQIAQETQVVVREDNKRDHLKRSTEDVSPPNFSERNSGYYERNSRLVSETDSYLRRSNNNSYQSSSSSNTNNSNISSSSSNNNNNSSSNNPDNRSRTRDRLYRNGPNAVGVSTSTTAGSSAATLLSERTSSGASSKINNSRVPPTSWYEAAATYTNGPGGSGNADVSAANINHYQTAASTELQAAAAANSTTTSSYTAYSYASSPAHNNNNHNTTSTTTSSSSRNSTFYGKDTDKDSETNLSTTPPLLNKNKHKLLKSSSLRSGSASPTASSASATLIGGVSGAVLATMTSSSSTAASTSSSSSSSLSSTSNNNNSRNNQTANNSCSSVSSTINSSNTNNNNSLGGNSSSVTNTNTDNTHSGSGNVSGILNAAALAAAASKGGSSSGDGHKNHSSSGNVANSSSNASASVNTSSNNPSTSASHHTSRSAAHAHFHGRSTTSSSRSHSRSPSSYSSSHSSSSSSSSTASSHSHASSPVGGRDVEASSVAHVSSSRSGSRSLQSAVAVPGTSSSGLNPSGSNVCGSSSSSTSSTSSGTPTGNPVVHSEDNRPLAIRVRNLPARSSDTSLKDGLFHEYKKHGKVTWVKVVGQNAERYALVCFKKPEDVEKALEVSHDKLFFGCKIEVEPYQGYDVEDNEFRPYEAELDEYHPKSTRTLFIGNLEKEITASELRQHFECFGEIIEIDIKKQGMSAYAFCQYSDIVSVVKAMRKMDGEHLGNNRIKLGFGKSMPTNCVWIDGIGEKISESHLQSQFSRYGAVSKVVVDRQRQLALVLYEQIQYAQTAVKEMRGATLRGRKLQVDFASRECQDAFYEKLEKQSAGSRFNRYESQSRSRASSFSRHQNSNDGCSPGNTPGSSSSSSAGVPSSAPALSSAIVAGSSALSVSNTASGNTLASVVGQASGNTTPARSRGSRSSRHTMDYEYLDTRRFRSCDEYSQGSATSHDEDNSAVNHPSSNINSYSGIGLRSDSPLLSRLGPIVNSSGKESSSEMLEMALSRRRCDKSPAKQKGDIRLFQKERAVLLEQLEECPSSGDESIVSPRKRIKIDHHSINSSSGLTQSHSLDEQQQQPQHKNSNCDYLLNDPMHRKSEVRRLSECNSSLNKYPTPQQNHHHSHHAVPPPPPPHHHHHQQQLSRRPSIDFMATSGGGVSGGVSNLSTRHNSTSSSNSDHHPPPHQSSSSSSSLACKRRRVIGSSSSAVVTAGSLLSGSTGGSSNLSSFTNDDSHHHTSRGRGHQLHSHHSHEASGGESADGSRPGTPLCDERPEVLPSEPRRVPRERPREPMVLPLPKFGIQFFQQYRNSVAAGNTPSFHHHHHVGGSFTSSSAAALGGGNNTGSSHLLSNSILNRGEGGISNNSHSSLSHSSATITPASAASTGTSSGSCYLPSPSTRYPPHWRPHHLQHHHHQQHGGAHHGPSGGATPSSSSSMVSPMRSRSLSSNSSDSDVPGQSATGSPSLEERIRTLDEMYERWSGGGTNSSNTVVGPNVVKRHDFNHTPPTWQHHRSNSQSDSHHASNSDVRSNATPATPASRHKFLDIDVNEMQPSDIVKSVLAKKSIFDDDLQRLKKNHWYEPSSDSAQLTKATMGVCTSPGLPNLQATKTPVVGCTTSLPASAAASSLNKSSGNILQRLSSLSPMNSPQASMSPYNSPSPSPSVTLNSVPSVCNATMTKALSLNNVCGVSGPQISTTATAASTSPAASGGTKCLQYPFPTHPPLPNTAAPVQSAQPIPPPPAESSKPPMAQPPLPPMEVLQPPQPPATSPTSSTSAGSSTKPKTSALSKSLSVPPPPPTTATTESRIFTKSVSVPGSTNLGTVKSTADAPAVNLSAAPHLEQNQPQQTTTTGSSSLHPSKSHNKEDDTIAKTPSHSSASTFDSVVKRSEKSHKHNHRSSEDKKSSKNDRRKNSNSSQSHLSQASAAESSDADEHDSKKERKERQERREKELRKQQEREERERDEKERLEKERLEAERLEKERLERERLEKEERERVQREKERVRKEEEQRAKEERERKDREEKERKLNEQREREENERREREEREEQLRKERKEREEHEQKEKEKLERQRMRDEKERERKSQDESNTENKRDINLLKEHQRRKENAASQSQTKTGNDMATATSQSAHDYFRKGEAERQNNKENSTEETSAADTTSASSCKHKNRKTSRNTSPVRHPKRRLSSQDSNASNSAASAAYSQTDDHAKRMRIDLQSAANQPQTSVNNHNSVNNSINERRDSKEHHAKERSNKHNRVASSGHKGANTVNQSNEKEHNTKHHRNKHHHKAQPTSQGAGGNEATDVNVSKQETEHMNSNCIPKAEDDQQNTDNDMKLKLKTHPLLTSDEEEVSENPSTTAQHHNKNVSGNHKHREHGSGHHSRHKSNNCITKAEDDQQNIDHDMEVKHRTHPTLTSDEEEISENPNATTPHHNKNVSGNHKHREHGSGHHSRHKSTKRDREHNREKKRYSSSAGPPNSTNINDSVPSTPPSANCNVTDEEIMSSAGNQLAHRRTSGHSTGFELNTKGKHEVSDRKLSRCSEDGSAAQPQTPSHRQNNFNKNTPQSSSRRMLLSSADDTDGGGGVVGMGADDDDDSDNRQHSIFDIPDDGPYVSMYDKVKARSCKNMQKQEEEKKIKAKFSQLKQSRAKREEKKRSTSYDGDSDSDFDGASSEHQKHNRSGASYKMLTGGLSSSDDEQDMEGGAKTPSRDRRRSSQASSSANSIHPHRLCSDSDDNSVTQRRLKLQDNLRRLCDDGDDTSEDDLIRRHNSSLANKRLLHHTSRIASDSESQSQSAVDIKLKQEPLETSNDGATTPVLKHLKQKIKKEVEAMDAPSENTEFNEFKIKGLSSMCSSADEQSNIKSETAGELLSANEIKKESKDFYADEYLQSEQKFHKSPMATASQHCSVEQAKIKKHKKSKKRQKTPTQDSLAKEQVVADTLVKHAPQATNAAFLTLTNDTKNAKLLSSPCYDAFDELKRGDSLVTETSPDLQVTAEKKRHKERKEKKREKLRHMSADVGSGVELDKIVYEKEKHRLKKSKKSKSLDVMRQTSSSTATTPTAVNVQQPLIPSVPASCTPQHKQRSGGEKMEDIFGPISDEDDEDLSDSDIGGRDLNCIPNRNTSSSNMPGPIVSAALNPYKQEPLTPKSHTVEENEENKQKLTCNTIIGASAHLERVAERQHRKEKREKKRKEREKSRSSEQNQSVGFLPSTAVSTAKPMEDENSVDLDAAGRALEAQLMEDSDNKTLEDATPSTANTYRSDMTDVFLFSDCDENSLEMSSSNKHEKKETEKELTASMSCKNKEKKKKKKRSKEEKQLHHQRRESSSSNASQLASTMVAPSTSTTTKLTIDVQAATKHAQKSSEEHLPTSSSPLCKPSPSLPCLIGDDDDDLNALQAAKITPNTSLSNICTSICTTPRRSSSKDMLTLSPHLKDKQMISPIPKTPTINHNSGLNTSENLNKIEATTPSTPTSSMVGSIDNANAIAHTTPTSSTAAAAKSLNKSTDSSASSNVMDSPSSSLHTTQQKKKPEIFIPGFDGEIDERISESAVQSISAEFNTPSDPMADEPKIPVESPPDASKLEKLEESKSRVTISQEETESAVSALLGESFGNSSADYSFNDDDDALDDLNNAITDPEPVMAPGEPDEEAALAAKAIECEVASSAIADTAEEDSEEVCKAIQSLRQEELDIKADTPQSVRDLQIDTDTEENADEADSSGSHSLKIDETAQSNNSSSASDKANTSNPTTEEQSQSTTMGTEGNPTANSSVITKVESPTKTQAINAVATEPKIEPPTISKQDQPAVQPVQAVLSPVSVEVSVASVASAASTSAVVSSSSSMSTSINTTTLAGVTMSYTSTPIKTSITFAPTSTSSSTPKQTNLATVKSITSPAAGYVMQPPTITIPEQSTHFVVPQLVLSPRGVVTTAHHNDSSSSSSASMHSPSGHHMPPQSPVGAAYLMGVRAQSPHSPRQHTSRGNTPTPRQSSPHTSTPTPAPIAVTPQHQQQQNILIQRTVQQHQQNLMSPPSQGHVSQNNSPLASPTTQQRQISQGASMHKVMPQQQQSSPNAPEQHMIKINNYSTPPSQTLNMVNIRIPTPSTQQQHGQLPSPQQQCHGKTVIDSQQQQQQQQQQQHVVPMGQHILPISVQKMSPVPTHPTIISKVVTVTPQQAQQSIMQQASGPGGHMYSPPTTVGSGGNQSRQSPQILQQLGGKTLHQQQQSPQLQFMQQQQRQQQHMMQMQQQQQQMMHQQQKLPQQQQQQTQHNFVVSQQRNLPSPQQIQQQSQNTQQLKVQYQQHQMLAPSQQSPTQQQQQNVIQNAPLQQRFLVQQHIVGMPSQQQQQQQQQHSGPHQQPQTNSSPTQLQNSSPQQKPNPIFAKQQQQQQHHHLQQRQQSPSPQRLLQQQPELIKDSPRVIMSTNQSAQQSEPLTTTPATSKANCEKHSSSQTTTIAIGNKTAEGVSVIRTPTPTTTAAPPAAISVLPPNTTMVSNKESPTTTAAINTSRSVPLTEENVIKISPPKHDEIEQDSKEDSDYWSAKELNVVESNNTSNSNGSSVSTVIKKNESVNSGETLIPAAPTLNVPSTTKEQRPEETKSSQTQQNKGDSKTSHHTEKSDVNVGNSSEAQGNTANVVTTSSCSQSGNVTTDHDTEDETETQQMPAFEQVPVQGRPSTRGTGAKRGRQPRGGKKGSAVSNINNTPINTNVNTQQQQQQQTELGAGAGVQTRLRKPNTGTPATRGRKGRPPRNLLLQQQQQQMQQHYEQITPTPQTTSPNSTPSTTSSNVSTLATTAPVLTAAEKKARSQAAVAAAALASLAESSQQQQNQDVYEFHDESGDESKTTTVSTAPTATSANIDHRPRLILTIKSPAPGSTPLVKASEKTLNVEPTTVNPLNEQTTATAHSGLQENLANASQSSIQQTNQTEPTVAELAAAANTRKSRRLLEKDRSTIDDIIEDVVRNTHPAAGGNAVANLATTAAATNVLASTLPKGAQTPPRRSGRNSSQSKPSKTAEPTQATSANPIGRPRKSKDRKNTNELDIEQTPSPQPKHLVYDISDVEDAKSTNTPPPADITNVQTTQSQSQSIQVSAGNTTSHAAVTSLQQPATSQPLTATPSSIIPQHPKKKALAAAEIESYQSSGTTPATTATPNIHSALPAGGVPMLNTAAPATQKTTGGAADSVNKPLIDPVTGVVSGLQMQQAKEGNLPSATAASQPLRGPMDPKKMMQAAAAAAAAENSTLNSKLAGSVATPITALSKPQQAEATSAQVAASTVSSTMLNKSVSVVVKTSTLPPTPSSPANVVMQQQHLQMSQTNQQSQQHQQQRQDIGTPQKQPIIMQQQTASIMHAQHTNVRPPTSLKAHVLNSQKLQQQQQPGQQQYITQQQTPQQQQQTHQILHQQTTSQTGGGISQTPTHIIQNTILQRPTIATTANQQQQQLPQANKQLLVNIPPSTATHPSHTQASALNSPRHLPQHSQQQQQQQQQPQPLSSQQSLVIKQAHDMHTPQVLHVVSSKTSVPTTVSSKPLQSSTTTTVHQQPPNASPHPSYTTYIQTPTVGVHSKQQLPQKPVVIHQQTLGVPQKCSTTPLVMPPGILGLPPHPAMVIQTKASAPAQSPSAGASTTPAAHLQHSNQHTNHTPSPPLQLTPQHLVKTSNNPMIHSMQTQGTPHALNAVASPSPPSAVKPNAQQSSIASNVGASSLRTAIPTISPQSQARIGSILLPGGMQVPPHFETSMSEASFPGGMGRVGVPTREHIMIYQQLLRQHDPLNPPVLREYEEKLLGSSPPLELRRPGSVPRTVAVPHSLQSPQDRATDSPQVAQVYVHNTRIPAHTHYDVTGRAAVAAQPSAYYDASRQIPLEPPPAHRSAPVHSVVAPPPTVVVPHPTAGSSSPFMPAAPPVAAVQATASSAPPGHHPKILEREREQREREREQQLLREKEQIMVRAGTDGHSMQVATPPPHQQPSASHLLPPHSQQPPPPQADSLLTLLQRYPVMWQGLLALKTDQAAVQMHFVFGNPHVARASLPCNSDGSTPPLRIAQRMRLEQTQLEGVAKKMQFENEHCMLLALPCGRDHADVLQQSRNLQSGFITYLQQKMAAGIVNIPMPGSEQAAYVVHIFPSCDFANENLEKAAPDLKNRVADIAHLLIVIATV